MASEYGNVQPNYDYFKSIMEIEDVKKQLEKAMIATAEAPDETRVRALLQQVPAEKLPEILSLVKSCTKFADRERCRYFTMIRGAKHYHNCLVIARILEKVPA